MRKSWGIGILFITIIFFLIFLFPIHRLFFEKETNSQEIEVLRNRMKALLDDGQFDQAIEVGEGVLKSAIEKYGEADPNVAQITHFLGRGYYHQYKFEKCAPLWEKTLSILENCLPPDHPGIANSRGNLAALYLKMGKYKEAELLYRSAISITEKKWGLDHQEAVPYITGLANLYYEKGRYAQAGEYYEQVLEIQKQAFGLNDPGTVKILNNLASIKLKQGKFSSAVKRYRQALQIRESIYRENPNHDNESAISESLNNLAAYYVDLGRYAQAEPLYQRALRIKEKIYGLENPKVAISLSNLGNLYRLQGKYDEAENDHKRALDIREERLGPDHRDTAQTLNNLAEVYECQGRFADAEQAHNRALEIREKKLPQAHPDIAESLTNLGELAQYHGRYEEAESRFKKALEILKESHGPDHPRVAYGCNNLGEIYMAQGRDGESETFFTRALNIRSKLLGSNHPETASSFENLAVLYGASSRFEKSITFFKKFQAARLHFINHVFTYASQDQKMRYVEAYPLKMGSLLSLAAIGDAHDFDDATKLLWRNCQTAFKETAMEMVLKSKASVLDAVSAEKQITGRSPADEIQEKVKKLGMVCTKISTLTMAEPDLMDLRLYETRLRALYGQKDHLEAELSSHCTEFMSDLDSKKFEWLDVASAIPPESVLWEFVIYRPYDFKNRGRDKKKMSTARYLAFTLDHMGRIRVKDLGACEHIDQQVSEVSRLINEASSITHLDRMAASERQLRATTGQLYDTLFAPLEAHLGEKTDIFISPDGALNLLPFEILPCPDEKYVVEKYRISYLSSGRDFLKFKNKQQTGNTVLILADPAFDAIIDDINKTGLKVSKESPAALVPQVSPRHINRRMDMRFMPLPHSNQEAKNITEALIKHGGLNVQCYTGKEASEKILKNLTHPPKILHLATHAFFDDDPDFKAGRLNENPLLRCGLALAGANLLGADMGNNPTVIEDGILTALEVSGLKLTGTELVILSACETGLGEVKIGEGVYGLRRAFQHAGARTIISSLWMVPDDMTRELMENFYRHWLTGQPKKEAFRQSVLQVLNHHRREFAAHPYFWGAFVFLGDPK